MEQRNNTAGKADSMSRQREVPMDSQVESQTLQPTSRIEPATPCAHSRLIEEVLTRSGKQTGKDRCLECGTTFDDPYHGLK